MNKNDRIEESIRFVARHFSPEAFSRTKAWRRLGISAVSVSRFQLRRSLKYAAVGIGVVALTASAILLINRDASQVVAYASSTRPDDKDLLNKIDEFLK